MLTHCKYFTNNSDFSINSDFTMNNSDFTMNNSDFTMNNSDFTMNVKYTDYSLHDIIILLILSHLSMFIFVFMYH